MTTKLLSRRAQLLWTTLIVGTLSGCTNIKNDSDRTRAEGAVVGAAVGAAAGAGAGALLKKVPGGAAAGAAAGAVVGAAAGGAYGNSVAKKKEGYAAKETAIQARITTAQRQAASYRGYNNQLASLIAVRERQVTGVMASQRVDGHYIEPFEFRASLTKQLDDIDVQARSWQDTIEAHKSVLKKAPDDPHSAQLQTAIDQIAEQRAELLRQRARLSAVREQMKK